jgi:hypothetical protein
MLTEGRWSLLLLLLSETIFQVLGGGSQVGNNAGFGVARQAWTSPEWLGEAPVQRTLGEGKWGCPMVLESMTTKPAAYPS